MNTLYISLEKALAIVHQHQQRWEVDLHLMNSQPQCLAIDPLHPQFVYCGTFDQGLWHSSDAGVNWRPVGAGIVSEKVMAVGVSALEQANDSGVVYAGTEPT